MRGKVGLLLLALTIFTFLAIALIWTQITPKYKARAEIRIRPIIVFDTYRTRRIQFYKEFVNTQIAIMRSPELLDLVLGDPEVKKTKWYNESNKSLLHKFKGKPIPKRERLLKSLMVRFRPGSEILDASFTCKNAGDAEIILNSVVNNYIVRIRYLREEEKTLEDAMRTELYQKLKQDIESLEDTINQKSKDYGTLEPTQLISSRLALLDRTKTNIEILDQHITLLEESTKSIDPTDSNQVIENRFFLDSLFARIGVSVSTKDLEFAASMSTSELLKSARKRLQFLQQEYDMNKVEFDKICDDAQIIAKLNNQLADKRSIFDQIGKMIEVNRIERSIPAEIQLLTPAYSLNQPYKDNRIKYTGITLGLYLIMVIGVIALKRERDRI